MPRSSKDNAKKKWSRCQWLTCGYVECLEQKIWLPRLIKHCNGSHTFAPVFEFFKWLSFYSLRQEGSRYSMILVLILIQCLCLNLLWQAHFWSVNLVVGTTMAQRISAPNMSDQICRFSQVQSVAVQIRRLNQIAFADFAAQKIWAKTTKLDSLIAPLGAGRLSTHCDHGNESWNYQHSGHRLQESTRLLDNVEILGYVGVLPFNIKDSTFVLVGLPPTSIWHCYSFGGSSQHRILFCWHFYYTGLKQWTRPVCRALSPYLQ